ncbi:MAG: S9 family peptidase [Sphingomonadales bacterium]|nr:S9 family peptidase [Sphingomonadales bacterium]MBK9005085.1 S9 family peptidase [Sphingomonadales bacterium]MBK9267182.1 S9 family peptidase [Sphingomonadales bacterium]MBP6433476.1 S9 family peptidase [Sphingorhabdus sp.]
MTAKTATSVRPPIAEKRPHSTTVHGVTISDDYHWLRDQGYPKIENKEILAHLEAENAYYEAQMAPQAKLVETIFQEMKGRIKEDDSSVPQKDGDYIYWSKFDEGAQYRKHYRKPVKGGADQLILDENVLAEGKDYFRLGAAEVSPDGKLLAYAYDDNGSERFDLHISNLETGEELKDIIPGTLSSIVWTKDSKGLVYGLANENWRTDNAHYHRLGDDPAKAKLLYKEADIGFGVGVGLTAQEDWIVIATGDNVTSEVRLVPADNPAAEPILVSPRKVGREYSVDIRDGTLYILTNDDHVNFRVATASLKGPGEWETLIAGSDRHYLTGVSLFRDFFVTEGRIDGLDQVEVRRYDNPTKALPISFPEASYVAGLGDNPEYAVEKLRLDYESMVTPDTVFDYTVATGTFETLKVQEIPSGYDASQYVTERVMIAARDGARVPVSIVYRKGFKKDGSQPLHLYAYGAYGYAMPPGFSANRLSYLDRGFAYAIAHIRGGDDLGYQWYLDGKLTKRTNTFNDFVDAGKALIDMGYTGKGKLTASGGSAGGELMGAVVNQAPEIFGAVVSHVAFVDVLNTMLDKDLPLTPGEWPEWGNPITDKAAFDYIRSYSPYDNVEAKAYPPMLWTAGLNDPRVTYWEPAKMVAKLRAMKTDDNVLLLKTNMGAGHGGKSGRWERLRENAEEAAFLVWQMGVADAK